MYLKYLLCVNARVRACVYIILTFNISRYLLVLLRSLFRKEEINASNNLKRSLYLGIIFCHCVLTLSYKWFILIMSVEVPKL